MTQQYKTATVFGGTGFIGTQIVRELAKLGIRVKIATRIPESAYFLKPCGSVGQITPVAINAANPESIEAAIKGSDVVINCIGILAERKKGQFDQIHTGLPGMIAKYCTQNDVERFVHISALGIEQSRAKYAISKQEGEKAVLASFPKATILRPSIVFGEDDSFFNKFARLAQILPSLPLIGGGRTKFQPVFVGDVADAVIKALTLPAMGDKNPQGRIYELGGPDILNFKELYEKMFEYTRRPRKLKTLPWGLAKLQACALSMLPNPPITADQITMLRTDNIVSGQAKGLRDLNVSPTDMDIILPTYLDRYRPGGRFAENKAA